MIVIVGATGKVGSQTAGHLMAAGKKVRLIARHEDKLKSFQEKGAEIAVGSASDRRFLTRAFEGADCVLTMIPTDFTVEDVGDYQDQIGIATLEALQSAGVRHVVNLSSVGGHTEVNTGIVAGLARQEIRLNGIEDIHVLHLRPTYFMENLLGNIPVIKANGFNGSAMRPDVAFPLIASKDIAAVIAQKLMECNFSGKWVQPLLGPRNYTMEEVTRVLGKAIGNPDLNYMQFSYQDAKAGLLQAGASESIADAFVGLAKGINLGVFSIEKRDNLSTTPTTLEEFAETFARFYHS